MPRIIPPDPFGSFLQGRQARQQEDYTNTRNALARMELENAPAEMQRRNKLADMQVQSAEMGIDRERAMQGYTRLRQALDSGNPRQYVLQREPELAAKLRSAGVDLASVDDETALQVLDGFAREYAGKAGIAPAAPAGPMSPQGRIGADVKGGYLTQEQADAALNPGMTPYQRERLEIERQKLNQKPQAGNFRALTPDEVQQAGLPPGTAAQVGPDGKIDVLSKRDTSATLSQKDATTAKQKLTTIQLAKKQIADIKAAFQTGTQGTNAFGPVQGYIPTQKGKKFDAAVDRMRSTLTALTRVPGVGAMSDYETKLDQAKFPNRKAYESVTAEQIQGIEDMLALIENGYTNLLSGGGQQEAPVPAAPDINALLDKYAPR